MDSVVTSQNIPEIGSLYEPVPVAFSFEAIGWTILLTIFILSLALSLYLWLKSYNKNKYRREALARLGQLRKPEHLPEIFVILKYTAMITYGREKIARKTGKEWLVFLDQTAKNSSFEKHASLILRAIYTDLPPEHSDFLSVKTQASHWIKSHASKL